MNKLLSIFTKNRLFQKSPVFDTRKDIPSEITFTPSHQTDFILLNQLSDCKEQAITLSKGIIITSRKVTDILAILENVRSSNKKEVYLKPVFLRLLTANRALNEQVDGIYSEKQMHLATQLADLINERIEKIEKSASQRDVASTIITKTVQYLYTRDKKKLTPFQHNSSNTGYAFPFLNSFFPLSKNDQLEAFLQQGATESWLEIQELDAFNLAGQSIKLKEYQLSFIGEKLAKTGYYEAPVEKLPNGVVSPTIFQTTLDQEIVRSKRDGHTSFVVQIGLVKENLAFLPTKAQKDLALECLELAKKNFGGLNTLTFSKDEKIWVLMPKLTQQQAVETVKQVFFYMQKLLHDNLDTQQSLLEVNMYSVLQELPTVKK